MGCDGGTIPRRDELVRVKKKPEQVKKKQTNTTLCHTLFFTNFVKLFSGIIQNRKTKMLKWHIVGGIVH